jgi:hypothetical protein
LCDVLQQGPTQTFPNQAGGNAVDTCSTLQGRGAPQPFGYQVTLTAGRSSKARLRKLNFHGAFAADFEGCTLGSRKVSQHLRDPWPRTLLPGLNFGNGRVLRQGEDPPPGSLGSRFGYPTEGKDRLYSWRH